MACRGPRPDGGAGRRRSGTVPRSAAAVRRRTRSLAVGIPFGIAVVVATPGALRAGDTPPARWSEIERARDAGGAKAVKALMKSWMKRAKKADVELPSGAKLRCGGCHENLKTYPLRANAEPDLRAMLGALQPDAGPAPGG